MDRVFDITIIGGGPTGLFAAFYAGFRGLSVKILDSQPALGGQVTALYPDKYIYDVPGFPRILGKDLVGNLIQQVEPHHPAIVLNEEIQSFQYRHDRTIALGGSSGTHLTKVTLVTAGIGAFAPRTFGRPEVDVYEGRGLFYVVRSREEFRDRSLLIVGGGDSAVDWALNLIPVARRITLIHRRGSFRAHADSVRKLLDSPVTVKVFHELRGLRGEPEVSEAIIMDTKTGQEETLGVDAVLAFLGLVGRLGSIASWGLTLDGDAIVVDTRLQTNLPEVFAAGDVVTYPGKLRLIATGFGEAATAVNNAVPYIQPEAPLFPGHSSAIMEGKARRPAGELQRPSAETRPG